jgi:predicted Fe-Mo cluster-binding NifX family protein/ferredoxin
MKVAVTSSGPTLDDQVEARFRRCPYFLIVDTDSMQFEAVENPNIALGGGAGIQSAQMMAEKGVSHVLTGNCGPNAFRVFGEAGVEVVVGVVGPVRKAVERFKAGELAPAAAPNVARHFGVETGGQPGETLDVGFENSLTRAPRMGMGRETEMGGRCGMGAGRDMSRGRGMGFGMGRGSGMWGFGSMHALGTSFHIHRRMPAPADKPSDRSSRQGSHAGARAGALESGRKAAALVRTEKCAGCGICVAVCPVGAIRVEQHAVVDPSLCTACAVCVSECPNEAIIIVQQRI